MSKFVDERIVEMSFDNKKFESNVKTSRDTIDRLKGSLDFSNTSKNISKNLSGIDTNTLTNSILGVKNSFSAFEIASIAAIANITNRIVDMGIQMVKSLSVDQISSGWAKFGESAVSEATLLAQGFSQEDVTATLEKLLWYTDETSYSFTDMLNNMSKFTATGQGLDESAKAMMGIANWAALSGQNSTTASRAMYQLSQAMSTGAVRLMDYKSIQTANMDTKEFRETVLQTAVDMGQLNKLADGTFVTLSGKEFSTGQFTTELDELWFTSEVLMSSLDKYASGAEKIYEKIGEDSSINTASEAIAKYGDELGDLEKRSFLAAQEARTFKDAIVAVKDAVASGWMNIFNNIFGSVNEAKVLWSDLANELYDVFMDGMWKKIDILGIWAENGGRDDLFANTEENTGAFWNLFNAIKSIKDLIGGAWQNVFGFSDLDDYDEEVEDIANKLKNLTSQLKDWSAGVSKSFRDPTEEMNNLLIGGATSLGQLIENIDGTYTDLEGNILNTNDAVELLKSNAGILRDVRLLNPDEFTELEERKQTLETFTNILTGIFSIAKILGKALSALWTGIQPLVTIIKSLVWEIFGGLGIAGESITEFTESTLIFEVAGQKIASVLTTIIEAVKSLNILQNAKNLINDFIGVFKKKPDVSWTGVISSSEAFNIDAIEKFSMYMEVVPNRFQGFADSVKGFGQTIKNVVSGISNFLSELIVKFKELNVLDHIKKIVTNVIQGFKTFTETIVHFISVLKSMGIIEKIKGFIQGLFDAFKSNGGTTENYIRIFNGLKAAFEIVLRVLSSLFMFMTTYVIPTMISLMPHIIRFGAIFAGVFIKVLAWIGDAIVKFNEFTKTNDTFARVMHGVASVVSTAFNTIKNVFAGFGTVDTGGITTLSTDTTTKFSPLMSFFEGLGKLLIGLWDVLKAVAPVIGQLLGYIGNLLGFVGEKLSAIFSGGESAFSIGSLMDVAFWVAISIALYKMVDVFVDIQQALGDIIGGFADVLDSKAMMQYAEALKSLSMALLIMVVALVILASVDGDKLTKSIAAMGVLVGMLMGMMVVMKSMFTTTKYLGVGSLVAAKSMQFAAQSMLMLAGALMLMVIAVKILGEMDQKQMINGLMGLTLVLTVLLGASAIIGKNQKLFNKGAKGLIKMALAVLILSVPLRKIGEMSTESLLKGMVGISFMVSMIIAFSAITGLVKGANKTSKGLISLAMALLVMSVPLKIIGGMNWEQLARGIVGITAAAAVLVGMAVLSKFVKKAILTAIGMVLMGIALTEFAIALKILSTIPWDGLLRSAVSLVLLAGIIFGISKFMDGKMILKLAGFSLALSLLSIGLAAFGMSLKMFGNVNWGSVWAAMGFLTVLSVAAALFGFLSPTIALFGAALTILAVGLILFAASIVSLGSIKWTTLGKGLLIIVALFAILGVAAALLTPLIPTMLGLGVALLLFSSAVLVLGVGLTIVTVALGLFAGVIGSTLIKVLQALIQAGPMIIQALSMMLLGIINTLIQAIPSIITLIATVIDGLVQLLWDKGPTIIDTLVMLLVSLLKSLADKFPEIVGSLISMLLTLVSELGNSISGIVNILIDMLLTTLIVLEERLPEIISQLASIAATLVNSLVENIIFLIPELINAAYRLVIGLIDGVGQAIEDNAGEIRDAMLRFAGHLWNAFLSFFGIQSPSTLFFEAAGHMITGLFNGLKAGWGTVVSWFQDIAGSIGGFFSDRFTDLKNIGSDVINNVGKGLKSAWTGTKTWIKDTAGSIGGFFSDAAKGMSSVGSDVINGLKTGMEQTGKNIKGAVETVANNVTGWFKNVFGIKSPSRVFAEIGGYLDMGLANGIRDNSGYVYDSAEYLGEETIDGVNTGLAGSIQKVADLISNGMDDQLTIRPVMDLTDIQNGTNSLSKMIGSVDGYVISGSNEMASRAYKDINTKTTPTRNKSNDNPDKLGSDEGGNSITNTFNISGNNPKEIAKEVSEIIQKQIDRRNAKWAT